MTVRQLADREGVSRAWVYKAIRRAGLPVVRASGYRIRLSEYMAWLDRKKVVRTERDAA